MDVDRPRLPVVRAAPERLEQPLPRVDDTGGRGESAEELELDVGELDVPSGHAHRPPGEVDRDVPGLDRRGVAGARPRRGHAAQERPDAAPELPDRERLRDVVVGAELEPEHLVELVVAGREHDDRHGALGAQALADLEPVELREHDVEDDEVDGLLAEALERLLAVARRHDAEAVALERIGQKLLDGLLVVDEEDGRGICHDSMMPGRAAPAGGGPRLRRHGRSALDTEAAGQARLAGAPGQRPHVPRHVARALDSAAAGGLQRGPAVPAAAGVPPGLRLGVGRDAGRGVLALLSDAVRREAPGRSSRPTGTAASSVRTGSPSARSRSRPRFPGTGASSSRTSSRRCAAGRTGGSSCSRTGTTSAPGPARTTTRPERRR